MSKADDIQQQLQEIQTLTQQADTLRFMEVCGTHTVSLFRSGVRSLLPRAVQLISGPGCPVCVTSQGYIDAACELASRNDVIITTYGDMVRVPGRGGSLAQRRADGAKVEVIYSIRDALRIARETPDKKVVFLAVGFETTAPATAAALDEALQSKVNNFSILPGHKHVMPAMNALVADTTIPLDGFLCPGHVSVIIGANAYKDIAEKAGKPCVVAGFEPPIMLDAIKMLAAQVVEGRSEVENAYSVAVSDEGNPAALALLDKVFEPCDEVWRAMGVIPGSGMALREAYRQFDARGVLGIEFGEDYEPAGCQCGSVIQGKVKPPECPLFAKKCTPSDPVGPCMVSSEGTCAAYYKYGGTH